MINWQDEYKRKFVSPEEAVNIVESGDTVIIPVATEPQALSRALMDRKNELKNVKVLIRMPNCDFGWFGGDLGDAFNVILDTQPAVAGARAMEENRTDLIPFLYGLRFKGEDDARRETENVDVAMVVVSPPDNHGFCSFGLYLAHKKDYARRARKVLAEVSDAPATTVRTFGDNYIHVSDIDFFVEHIPVPFEEPRRESGKFDKQIAEYVATVVRDGDTVELGPGLTSSLPTLGAFDGKNDLGVHAPVIGSDILGLVRRGIVTGQRKNIHPGKSVSAGFRWLKGEEDIAFIDGNPAFEVWGNSYVNDIRVIASNNQMVAINGILAVDLSGQITADSMGARMFGGAGGQVDFSIGAMLSKGGCSISVLYSTHSKGTVSRIVPNFEAGTIVSVPWLFTDYVVTEYGVAKLFGKSRRQRAEELIAIAHPDFRAELAKEAKRLF
ncbi:acetyl-CoA hydrolase/transferase family protein [Chloroflexota bacterium]